ncbi:MAG: hypothetical protein NC401_19850 [Ruminococcus sp.]|nr:hypothetical protein [Ruminococcus sp.]
MEVEKALAAERMLSGGKADPVPTLAQGSEENKKGKSRDITAEVVGFKNGIELERSIKAVKKIDELTAQGRMDDAQYTLKFEYIPCDNVVTGSIAATRCSVVVCSNTLSNCVRISFAIRLSRSNIPIRRMARLGKHLIPRLGMAITVLSSNVTSSKVRC